MATPPRNSSLPFQLGERPAQDAQLAAVGAHRATDALEQRGLARSVAADEREDDTALDAQACVAQHVGPRALVAEPDVAQLDDGIARGFGDGVVGDAHACRRVGEHALDEPGAPLTHGERTGGCIHFLHPVVHAHGGGQGERHVVAGRVQRICHLAGRTMRRDATLVRAQQSAIGREKQQQHCP